MVEVGQLSVRQDKPEYGQLAPSVQVLDGASPRGRRNLVLLVHGYAESQATASANFQTGINTLQSVAGQANSSLLSPIFKFYWPGDLDIPVLSQLSYPWQIRPAVESGLKLGDFLAGLAGPDGTPVEIHFVSHSLGARVALETIKHLLAGTKAPVLFRSMSLMAAAVTVHMVGNPSQLRPAATLSDKRQVLFSSSDLVLMIAFRLGETVALEGFFPEAVGSYGHPNGMWLQQNMKGFNHWSYWPSPQAATCLANFLQVPVAVPPPPNAIAAHSTADARSLPTAGVPARTLAARALG